MQWAIIIGTSSQFLLIDTRSACQAAFWYQLYSLVLFFCFGAAVITEGLLFWESCKGARKDFVACVSCERCRASVLVPGDSSHNCRPMTYDPGVHTL